MYTASFGLRCHPFEDRADAAFFFPSASHEEAISAMQYEIQHGGGVGLLLGETGAGKTILIRALTRRLSSADKVVVLTIPSNGGMDILRETCKGFGVSLPATIQDARGLARLQRHLSRSVAKGNRSVLIIDQSENLTPGDLADVESLVELQSESGRLLRVVLAGLPRFRGLLEQPAFSRFRQLAYNEHRLSPLSAEDVEQYVRHRLSVAGAANADIFSQAAIDAIHAKSQGVPRIVNQLCNAAMLAAYGEQSSQITAGHLGEEECELVAETSDSESWAISSVGERTELRGLDETVHEELANDRFKSAAALEEKLQAAVGDARRAEAELRRRIPQASEVASRVESRADAAARDAEATIGSVETRLMAVSRRAELAIQKIEQVEQVFARAESLEKRLTSFAEQLADQMEEIQARVAEIANHTGPLDEARNKLDESIRRAGAMREEFGELARGEISQMKEMQNQAKQTLHKTSMDVLEAFTEQAKKHVKMLEKDVETAAGKALGTIQSTVQESQATAKRLGTDVKADIEKAAASASELIRGFEAQAGKWKEKLDKSGQVAAECIRVHEAKFEKWNEELEKAGRIVEAADQKAAQRSAELRQEVEQTQRETQNAHEAWAGLRALQSELTQAESRLGAELSSARTLGDSLGASMNHADGKLSQLASCQAAASHLHERMSRMLQTAHPVVDQGDAVLGKLQQNVEQGERLYTNLGEASRSANAETEKAQEASARAVQEWSRLTQEIEKAVDVGKQLAARHEQAVGDVAGWQACRAEASQLLPRLEKALGVTKTAAEVCEKLGSLIPSGAGIVETLSGLLERTGAAQSALQDSLASAQIVAEKTSLETEASVREFAASTRQFEQELAESRHQVGALETQMQQVAQQAAATQSIAAQLQGAVDNAHHQSENLERVCVAVRKVFAGLSQATLQARNQSSELEESIKLANQTAQSFQRWVHRVRHQLTAISGLAYPTSTESPRAGRQSGSVEKEAQLNIADEPGAEPAHLVEGGLETNRSPYSAPAMEIAELIERARRAKSGEAEAVLADAAL